MKAKITGVERILLDVPLKERPARAMGRQFWHWSVTELCRVESDAGLVGYGETIPTYTWARVPKEALEGVVGKNPFELLWEDSLGAGLQMAIWDLAGKLAGLPCYRLIGEKVREWCPISWWAVEMPPEDHAAECAEAASLGYTHAKLKCWAWRDPFAQVEAVSTAVPEGFEIGLDFNSMLQNAGGAIPILLKLARYPQVALFESPIPQGDVAGNKRIQAQVALPIAMHYGSPPIMTALKEEVCDGFVLCAGAAKLCRQAEVLAEANKPFWLQLVGTGLTTAYALHFGAAFSHALWSAVTCWEMYSDDLIVERFAIQSGLARVPEGPGLGVEVDEEAIAKYRVAVPYEKPEPKDVYAIVWPDGRRAYYGSGEALWDDFHDGIQPGYSRGVRMETYHDDGSAQFRKLRQVAKYVPAAKRVVARWV